MTRTVAIALAFVRQELRRRREYVLADVVRSALALEGVNMADAKGEAVALRGCESDPDGGGLWTSGTGTP